MNYINQSVHMHMRVLRHSKWISLHVHVQIYNIYICVYSHTHIHITHASKANALQQARSKVAT